MKTTIKINDGQFRLILTPEYEIERKIIEDLGESIHAVASCSNDYTYSGKKDHKIEITNGHNVLKDDPNIQQK